MPGSNGSLIPSWAPVNMKMALALASEGVMYGGVEEEESLFCLVTRNGN
jgi:hypothetical protein